MKKSHLICLFLILPLLSSCIPKTNSAITKENLLINVNSLKNKSFAFDMGYNLFGLYGKAYGKNLALFREYHRGISTRIIELKAGRKSEIDRRERELKEEYQSRNSSLHNRSEKYKKYLGYSFESNKGRHIRNINRIDYQLDRANLLYAETLKHIGR